MGHEGSKGGSGVGELGGSHWFAAELQGKKHVRMTRCKADIHMQMHVQGLCLQEALLAMVMNRSLHALVLDRLQA